MSVRVTRRGEVALLTLDRPDRMNMFNAQLLADLATALQTLAADPRVGVLVIAGAGRSFCAGSDPEWLSASVQQDYPARMAEAQQVAEVLDALWNFPRPTLAAVQGAAVDLGAALVACCDLAIASETARLGFAEVKLGMVPALVARAVVPKIGVGHARALMISGERFSAERAFEIGLVHAVCGEDELLPTADTLAARLLTSAPGAVLSTRRAIDAAWDLDRAEARQYLIEAEAAARGTPAAAEGIAALREKRRPHWVRERSDQ